MPIDNPMIPDKNAYSKDMFTSEQLKNIADVVTVMIAEIGVQYEHIQRDGDGQATFYITVPKSTVGPDGERTGPSKTISTLKFLLSMCYGDNLPNLKYKERDEIWTEEMSIQEAARMREKLGISITLKDLPPLY